MPCVCQHVTVLLKQKEKNIQKILISYYILEQHFFLDGTIFLICICCLQFNFFLTRLLLQPYGSKFPYFEKVKIALLESFFCQYQNNHIWNKFKVNYVNHIIVMQVTKILASSFEYENSRWQFYQVGLSQIDLMGVRVTT